MRRYNADRTKRQRREEHDVPGMVAGGHRAAADRAERNADKPLPANEKRTCLPRPDVLGGSTDCEGRTDELHPVRGGHHPPLGERTLPNRPALQQIRHLSGRGGRNRRIRKGENNYDEETDGAAAVRRNADGRRGGTGGKRV